MTKQTWPSWTADFFKSLGLGFAFSVAAVEALYWAVRNFGTLWWLVLWGLGVGVTLMASYVGPVLLLPLFYRVSKVENTDLNDRLQGLTRRAGIKVMGVYEFNSSPKTERGTAALAGLGRTRRVLLSDHILQNYTGEEVEGILAHELAHHIQRDPLLQILLSSSIFLLALFLSDQFVRATVSIFEIGSLAQVSNLPLFVLFGILFSLVMGPMSRRVSRWRETRADVVGASLCGKPHRLASALVRLHNQNLSVASPSPLIEALFYTHPSGRRRVEMLLALAEEDHET